MPEKNSDEEVKKGSLGKIILMVLIGFPLLTMILLYTLSDSVKSSTNNVLKKVPIVKTIVRGFPTKEEVSKRQEAIAKHYVEDLDARSAADKLYIVKKEDEKLFRVLVSKMDKLSTEKTKAVLDEIRNLELRKDLVTNLYEDVEDEKMTNIKGVAAKLEGMTTRVAVEEINKGDIVTEEEFVEALSYMNDSSAVEILYYLDGGTRSSVLSKLSSVDMNRKQELQNLLSDKRVKEEELNFMSLKMAAVYGVKKPEEAIEEIGNTEENSIDLLSRIYMNLTPDKAAEILVHSEDTEFLTELFDEIRKKEELLGIEQSIGVSINNIMTYLKEYQQKVKTLSVVYDKMSPEEAAATLEKLIKNKESITVFSLIETDGYKLSDYTVAVDIMKKIKGKRLAEIFEAMTPESRAQMTKILAIE